MAELLTCRRAADPVGGDTACQHEVMAQSNVAAPASSDRAGWSRDACITISSSDREIRRPAH
jgi:hypothetical protein